MYITTEYCVTQCIFGCVVVDNYITNNPFENGMFTYSKNIFKNCFEIYNSIYKLGLKIQNQVIRIRKSKKNRQHNGQLKKNKMTNNDLQNIHIKLKIE